MQMLEEAVLAPVVLPLQFAGCDLKSAVSPCLLLLRLEWEGYKAAPLPTWLGADFEGGAIIVERVGGAVDLHLHIDFSISVYIGEGQGHRDFVGMSAAHLGNE